MIELSIAALVSICVGIFAILTGLGTWIYKLGSRLTRGSMKITALESDVEKLGEDIKEVRTNQGTLGAKLETKFARLEKQMVKVATVLELLHSDLRGGSIDINLKDGE